MSDDGKAVQPKTNWSLTDAFALANTLANHGWTCAANPDAASSCIYALCRLLKDGGNAAAMHEALEKVVEIAEREWDAFRETSAMWEMHEICTAALSAPPRNCDVYSHDEALRVWAAENENERNGCFDEWLYHIATEQKGETDGSK